MFAFNIQITSARLEQKTVIAQLYELYTYEMTDLADFDINENGYYGYAELFTYWQDPNRRPYLIWVNQKLAGFVLIQQGFSIENEPNVWDIAEFFIMRKFRKKRIGEFVAHQIFEKHRGRWQVRVWNNNKIAYAFWDKIITTFTKNSIIPNEKKYPENIKLMIYKFDSSYVSR